ncbi:MAG: cold shock domain-containing protein [Litorilinea sp.]
MNRHGTVRQTVRQPSAKRQDRTLFCQRCGIAFLWTSEEQGETPATMPTTAPTSTANADAPGTSSRATSESARRTVRPSLCPGCRRLEPLPGRERGLVKWYNRRKRFGFITRKDQPDIFVHGSQLQDRGALVPDQLVEFSIEENDQGLIAAQVIRLEIDAPTAQDSASAPAQ